MFTSRLARGPPRQSNRPRRVSVAVAQTRLLLLLLLPLLLLQEQAKVILVVARLSLLNSLCFQRKRGQRYLGEGWRATGCGSGGSLVSSAVLVLQTQPASLHALVDVRQHHVVAADHRTFLWAPAVLRHRGHRHSIGTGG
eukprot:scaffold2708_cov158-Ochromonas_danica.AAC.42